MFMESQILLVSCKVNVKPFARDPKYSWFHEHSKYLIHSFLKYFMNSFTELYINNIESALLYSQNSL